MGMAQLTSKEADLLLHEIEVSSTMNNAQERALCDKLILAYTKSGNICKQIKALALSGRCEINGGHLKEATQKLLKAEKMLKASKCNRQLYSTLYLYRSMIYYKFYEDYNKSDSLAKLGIANWKEGQGEESILFNLYIYAGNAGDDFEHSLKMYRKALSLAKSLKLYDQELAAINAIGYAYAVNGDFSKAAVHFKEALVIAKRTESFKQLGMIYNNLAGLSADNEKRQEEYLDSAIFYAKQAGDLAELQDFTENKALFYKNIGNYKFAYSELWEAFLLQDSLLSTRKVNAVAEMQEKYESERKSNEIQKLKLAKLESKRNQSRLIIGLLVVLLIAGFFGLRYVTIRKNRNQLAKKNAEIEEARRVSDELLLNILPEEVADELKISGVAQTHRLDEVSVLFTDFIDFTTMAEKLSATDLVVVLNQYFKEFDGIMEKYGIEKIKTSGDSYMAAGNVPVPLDNFAKQTVLAALEMQSFVKKKKTELEAVGKPFFEMRLGINVGTVVAGIVGVKKFQYDIWGDTVNTASRLETNGEKGKVNISNTVYEILKEDPAFTFQSRGQIKAKGKGMVEMYFVDFA